jgi:E3 ubiquitin-protein ligase MYCBP2
MFKLAYYMCFKCTKPYFGGMKDCLVNANEKVAFNPEELVCGVCVAESLGGEANCKTHGNDYIEYKCRFCCSIA